MARERMKPTDEMVAMLKKVGNARTHADQMNAQHELAVALELPIRQGILAGDIISDIFEIMPVAPGTSPEFPVDLLAPGTEKDHVAYTLPNHGRIPESSVEGDYITIPTFEYGHAIDWLLKYAREGSWDIVSRCLQVLEAGMVKKANDDGWHTLLAALVDRNIMVYDSAASAGQFTKRLVSLMKNVMRRNGGGNSASNNRSRLTDLYLSPEGVEDIRDWGVDQIDEYTRREIFTADDGALSQIYKVNLHDLDELGVGQEYQTFFTSDLSGSLQGSDVELVVGLDLGAQSAFVRPVKQEVQVYEDSNLHRQRRAGLYTWGEHGFAVLDGRKGLAGSF